MIKLTIKTLLLLSCLSFFLGISSKSTNKDISQQSRSISNSKKYPPPPKDKSKFPKPIRDYINAISDLCKVDSFEQQLQSFKTILEGLRDAVSFYTTEYPYKVSTGYISSMMGNLADNAGMRVVWKPMLERGQRMDVAGQFLLVHSDLFRTPDISGDTISLAYDWAETIYRGLHCLSRGYPTTEKFKIIY